MVDARRVNLPPTMLVRMYRCVLAYATQPKVADHVRLNRNGWQGLEHFFLAMTTACL